MVFCSKCGTENDDSAVICTNCHEKLYSAKTNWEFKFVVLVAILAIGVILISIIGLLDNMAYIPTISGENISAYKSSCAEIDLNKPQEDLEALPWQNVKVKGELLDSSDGTSDRAYFYLKVANVTYYPYVDVSYSGKIPFKEGDELEVYGEYSGFSVYDNVTIPFIRAAYIEKI
jgi:hypothetical protein